MCVCEGEREPLCAQGVVGPDVMLASCGHTLSLSVASYCVPIRYLLEEKEALVNDGFVSPCLRTLFPMENKEQKSNV